MSGPTRILKRYGLFGALRLAIDLMHTRLFFRSARLVRRPVYVRGRQHIRWGTGFTSGVGLRLDAFPESDGIVLRIGKGVQVNDYVHIAAVKEVRIGNDSLIASKVFITDHQHGEYQSAGLGSAPGSCPIDRPLVSRPVRIGDRVWIGEQVAILPGVTIGDDAVIGAGSVVTHDIPAGCIAAGNPARVIKEFDAGAGRWTRAEAGDDRV